MTDQSKTTLNPFGMSLAELRAEIERLELRLAELRRNLLWRTGP